MSSDEQSVPGVGLEPTRPEGHRILSPTRLPIPPPGQGHGRAAFSPEFLYNSRAFPQALPYYDDQVHGIRSAVT